ncbi:uncharacterized protein LOC129456673 [Periophthalmus magnuspinnatus]|uniref:uncharacterized protein LOC129456673 n=1 Tax=Periophthalmus magnuspinnatus TaxID=409849 RepID=UPI0024368C22|nr:uncharacterized protein LOC129456673 [Periophthalmus magnuspinnatus]
MTASFTPMPGRYANCSRSIAELTVERRALDPELCLEHRLRKLQCCWSSNDCEPTRLPPPPEEERQPIRSSAAGRDHVRADSRVIRQQPISAFAITTSQVPLVYAWPSAVWREEGHQVSQISATRAEAALPGQPAPERCQRSASSGHGGCVVPIRLVRPRPVSCPPRSWQPAGVIRLSPMWERESQRCTPRRNPMTWNSGWNPFSSVQIALRICMRASSCGCGEAGQLVL